MYKARILMGSLRTRLIIIGFVIALIPLLAFSANNSTQKNFDTVLSFNTVAAQSCDVEPPEGYTQQISGLVEGDELTIRVSSRFAGAVESLTWRGKEFINIFDHGRQISYAWQMDDHGECFNPTEPGSASDLFSQTSTSQLLEVCVLDINRLTTKTQPAFWLAPGETGFCDGDTVTAVNDALVSDQILDKSIEIGYMGIDNVIVFTAEITIPQDYDFLQLEIPTGYLTHEFTNYWLFDPLSGELMKPESQPLREPWSYVHDTQFPPILATEDGEYAMGAYSPEDITSYSILHYDVPNPDDATNKWNIVLHEFPAPAGVYTYDSFAIVGTLEQVREGMVQLYEIRGTDILPPEGYVDLASCDVIDGWAWDPKIPNQPIAVEFREVNEDGTETTLATISANRLRDDLVTALGDNGRHGFNIPTSELIQDGDQHTIRVYGLNSNPNWPDQPLIPSENVLECPQLSQTSAPESTETSPPTPTSLPATEPVPTEPANEAEITPTTSETNGRNSSCIGGALPLFLGLTILSRKRRPFYRKIVS